MTVNRKVHSKEFKEQAVQLIEISGKPISEIAKDLGINDNMLRRWRDEMRELGEGCFPGKGHPKPETEMEEEIHRLKEELLLAQMERDILKKAVAIFSKPQK